MKKLERRQIYRPLLCSGTEQFFMTAQSQLRCISNARIYIYEASSIGLTASAREYF